MSNADIRRQLGVGTSGTLEQKERTHTHRAVSKQLSWEEMLRLARRFPSVPIIRNVIEGENVSREGVFL